MEFIRRVAANPARLGILPGSFNPPTRAHLGLARAALAVVDEVLFVLPRAFPHKLYEGASIGDRLHMLALAGGREPRFSIGVSSGGLFVEIARECREAYGTHVELYFLCGRDAAERIVNWDYGRPGAIAEQLRDYQLLVAPRHGAYAPPSALAARIHALVMEEDASGVSATDVRERIARGEPWEALVPESIVPLVERLYSRAS